MGKQKDRTSCPYCKGGKCSGECKEDKKKGKKDKKKGKKDKKKGNKNKQRK